MTITTPTTPRPGAPLAIGAASEALGVPVPTMRSWERRYGVPASSRSAGGHRRYTDGELDQLRLMRDGIASGKRASDAALAVRLLLDQDNPALAWITRFLDASAQEDPAGMHAVLEEACEQLGLATTIDQVLMPALRRVGAWWETGRCDVAGEHVATEASREWLAVRTALSTIDRSEPPILLACGPRDMHTVGLEALAALLAEEQRGSRILGARTSVLTLVTAARASAGTTVVITSHLHTHRRAAVDAIRAVAQTGCRLFYAGNAFAFPGLRIGVPGTYLGENISTARSIILSPPPAG